MSMISAQCDELRKAAQTYRTLGGYEMEQMLLDAADTITELRGALQVASVDYRHLSEENAKLRELVRHLRECTRHNVCAACEYADDACDFDYDMRELGLEVDG